MLNLLNLKFKGKKKKKISHQGKALVKSKKINFLEEYKAKFLKNKKFLLKTFFAKKNSLDQQKNLILPLLKLRKLNVDSLSIDNNFELKKSLFSLIKLSQILKMGSISKNSLEISPFLFQESFLVSSLVEKSKRKNSFYLRKRPLLFLTRFQELRKKEKNFKIAKKMWKRKNKKSIRNKKMVLVLQKTLGESNEKSLLRNFVVQKQKKQFVKAKKRALLRKGLFSVVKKGTSFLKDKEARLQNPNRSTAKNFGENSLLNSENVSVRNLRKDFFNVEDYLAKRTADLKVQKYEKNLSLKSKEMLAKAASTKKIKKSSVKEETLGDTSISSSKKK